MPKPAHKSGERGSYAGGVARREAILDATVDMIAEVGYHGLSTVSYTHLTLPTTPYV